MLKTNQYSNTIPPIPNICEIFSNCNSYCFANNAKCFPSLASHQEGSLEGIRTTVLKPLIGALVHDVSSLVEEIEDPLNNLSLLIKNNTNSKDLVAWRPTGIPEQDIIDHDVKVLKSQKKILEEAITSSRNKRIKLFERVKSGRAKCAENQEKISKFANILNETIDTCSSIPTESIEHHIVENLFFEDLDQNTSFDVSQPKRMKAS
ncbi:hypothetical protein Anas_09979 [Armadillidium nasatum]|uniref:Uncharacterized protein n=1 Tax=Armadillidium nasatum TaxID=96803 RepID=A0A5N5SWC7_9CRUS|nr:hypothetical protein Anas_09979 [Armadillidium nasatum]